MKMKGLRITFIGAGSMMLARNLISDILSYPTLQELHLMDIDVERLETITELAKRMTLKYAPNVKDIYNP